MTWRDARSIDVLGDEIDAAYPDRSKASDGTIGDAAHASRESDHNPWVVVDGVGIVRARDVTHDPEHGCDCDVLAERVAGLIALGAHPALRHGAYVIRNRRIFSFDRRDEGWRPYTGSNPHEKHMHVSVSLDPTGFDSTAGVLGRGRAGVGRAWPGCSGAGARASCERRRAPGRGRPHRHRVDLVPRLRLACTPSGSARRPELPTWEWDGNLERRPSPRRCSATARSTSARASTTRSCAPTRTAAASSHQIGHVVDGVERPELRPAQPRPRQEARHHRAHRPRPPSSASSSWSATTRPRSSASRSTRATTTTSSRSSARSSRAGRCTPAPGRRVREPIFLSPDQPPARWHVKWVPGTAVEHWSPQRSVMRVTSPTSPRP
jgi:hypothetical protein